MIIDGLKGYLIVDDSKKYVVSLTQRFYSGDGITIEIEEEKIMEFLKVIEIRNRMCE